MKLIKTLIFLLTSLMCYNALNAQRFKSGIVLGINNSQISGDGIKGYNKIGFSGGGRIAYILTPEMEILIDLLYSKKGSKNITQNNPFTIQLDYIEVPILFSLKKWEIKNKNFYRGNFRFGFSYGKLISNTKSVPRLEKAFEKIKYQDISFILEGGVMIAKNVGFSARYSKGITKLAPKFDLINNGLRVYLININFEFYFL